jgi:hypothetical protein
MRPRAPAAAMARSTEVDFVADWASLMGRAQFCRTARPLASFNGPWLNDWPRTVVLAAAGWPDRESAAASDGQRDGTGLPVLTFSLRRKPTADGLRNAGFI